MATAALFGSAITKDVGLRLLLCPLGSNVVIRTACCSVGVALPVYSTFKAIEKKDQNEQERWLIYWAVTSFVTDQKRKKSNYARRKKKAYGSFSLAEVFSDKILSWFPLYYYAKFAFLVWLQFPPSNGSRHLYLRHLRPFLLRYQTRLDQVAGYTSGEISKFLSAHQAEIQFITALLRKFAMAGSQMVNDVVHPVHPQGRPAIESRRQAEHLESDEDD